MWCYIDIKGAVNKTMPFKKKKKKKGCEKHYSWTKRNDAYQTFNGPPPVKLKA